MTDGTPGGGVSRLLPTSRLEVPSGGVLAPAITLLVLKLSVPTEPRELVRGRTSHGRR
ncbi:MAG TPA: hypothetical protein PLB30_08395 [Thermoleophilia bacterium]|nr:hypothetical protein [Thermoleophilia bacterium]HQG04339.1 hypothetical protein [Thermoleophilia bacterium]HQG54237.1 hypothetical protein [Thermoleophilia bacterium]HQJ98542.1 hypothetical protein [Thermoleophilia bacterium]